MDRSTEICYFGPVVQSLHCYIEGQIGETSGHRILNSEYRIGADAFQAFCTTVAIGVSASLNGRDYRYWQELCDANFRIQTTSNSFAGIDRSQNVTIINETGERIWLANESAPISLNDRAGASAIAYVDGYRNIIDTQYDDIINFFETKAIRYLNLGDLNLHGTGKNKRLLSIIRNSTHIQCSSRAENNEVDDIFALILSENKEAVVVVTRGEHGAEALINGKIIKHSIHGQQKVSSTAFAGAYFSAGFLASISIGYDSEAAFNRATSFATKILCRNRPVDQNEFLVDFTSL